MRILIADDHDLFRDAIAALIREQDKTAEVTLAANLGVALYAVNSRARFDIIVLDLCMPGMNGMKGAEDMLKKARGAPVVLMSGTQRSSIIEKAKAIGLQGFISKTLAGPSLFSALKLMASGEKFFTQTVKLKTIGTNVTSLTLPDWSPA